MTAVVSKTDVLILATYPPELEGLAGLLGSGLSAEVLGLQVRAKPGGIGLPMAAAGTVVRLEASQPRGCVLLGTCAAYPGKGFMPGQVVVGTRIVLAEASVLEGRAGFPEPMTGMLEPHKVLTSGLSLSSTRPVQIANPLAITMDAALANRYSQQLQCDVEHYEAFGVGLSCAPSHIPFAVVLGISHVMGPDAGEVWRRHHRAAAREAAQVVIAWLQSGAAGLPHRE
jgi:nucleoside phosphorylase